MFDLENPIQPAAKDKGNVRTFWNTMRDRNVLVPFVGNSTETGHSFLKVLRDLTELSDSFAACSKWIRRMCFGGRMGTVDIIDKPISGYSIRGESNLDEEEKEGFIQELKNMDISLLQLVSTTCKLRQHDEESGNHYLRIRVSIIESEISIKFIPIHYMHIAYEWTESDLRYFAICKDWSFVDNSIEWERVPASKIGEPFNWSKKNAKGGKLFETVVHVPNEIDEGDWYGRPWIRSVLTWMFSEYAQGDHRCKTDSSEVVAKKLFAFKKEFDEFDYCGNCNEGENEDGTVCKCARNKESSFKGKARVFREITTNEGSKDGIKKKKPSSIGLVEVESDFPQMYDMQINRDSAWLREGLEQAAFKIHGNFGVPRQLTKTLQSRSGLSGAELINLYLITDCDTVKPIQNEFENYWGFVFEQVFDLIGRDDLKKYGIQFPDKITPLVESLRQANAKDNTNREGVN